MKWLFIVLVLMLLTSSACHKDDEILPVPPATAKPAPVTPPEEIEEEVAPPEDLETESFQYGRFRNIPYRILVPRKYDSIRSYPLHVFLQGIGERGLDNEKLVSVGGAYYLEDSLRSRYRSFVGVPQFPPWDFWCDE